MKNIILYTITVFVLIGCSKNSNEKLITETKKDTIVTDVNRVIVNIEKTDATESLKLESIIISPENTEARFEILMNKKFIIYPPGNNNCYFFMDPATKKEYPLLYGRNIKFNETEIGPLKFSLIFEKFDKGIKVINLVAGKEAYTNLKMQGFYNINLEKK